jgi:ketosteroid isomerase-like protein
MSAPLSPREVFDRLSRAITTRQFDGLPDLYAEDAVVEAPYALPEPLRLEGREAIRTQFDQAANLPFQLTADNVVIHETTDPEVIIAEWDYHVLVTSTGREFHAPNIQVLRVRDGQIVSSRDFHHHAALAAAVTP